MDPKKAAEEAKKLFRHVDQAPVVVDSDTGERSMALNADADERYETTLALALEEAGDSRLPAWADVPGIGEHQQRMIFQAVLRGTSEKLAGERVGVTHSALLHAKDKHHAFAVTIDSFAAAVRQAVQTAQYLAAVGRAKLTKTRKKYKIDKDTGEEFLAEKQVEEIEQPPNETAAKSWLKAMGEDGYTDENASGNIFKVIMDQVKMGLTQGDLEKIEESRRVALLSETDHAIEKIEKGRD